MLYYLNYNKAKQGPLEAFETTCGQLILRRATAWHFFFSCCFCCCWVEGKDKVFFFPILFPYELWLAALPPTRRPVRDDVRHNNNCAAAAAAAEKLEDYYYYYYFDYFISLFFKYYLYSCCRVCTMTRGGGGIRLKGFVRFSSLVSWKGAFYFDSGWCRVTCRRCGWRMRACLSPCRPVPSPPPSSFSSSSSSFITRFVARRCRRSSSSPVPGAPFRLVTPMGDWHFPFLSFPFLLVRSFVPSSAVITHREQRTWHKKGDAGEMGPNVLFSSPARHATPRIRSHTSSTYTKFSSLFPELQIYTRRHAAVTDALATATGTRLPWTEPHSLNQLAHFYPNTIPISNEELTLLRGRRLWTAETDDDHPKSPVPSF